MEANTSRVIRVFSLQKSLKKKYKKKFSPFLA